MENTKLQQLTDKLYQEGLEKGRAEAESLVAEAEARAAKIVAEAEARAAKIAADAERKAEDVEKNAMTEIALAGKQAVAKIKSEIETLIVAKVTAEGIKSANLDPAFIKDMLLAVAANWNNGAKADLKALLPEAKKAELGAAFDSAAKSVSRTTSRAASRWARRTADTTFRSRTRASKLCSADICARRLRNSFLRADNHVREELLLFGGRP